MHNLLYMKPNRVGEIQLCTGQTIKIPVTNDGSLSASFGKIPFKFYANNTAQNQHLSKIKVDMTCLAAIPSFCPYDVNSNCHYEVDEIGSGTNLCVKFASREILKI